MIKLTKTTIPAKLQASSAAWTIEYADSVANDTRPRPARYRDAAIKDAIVVETCGKCAYCESKIRHITFGHIEHILPRAARPDLVVEWPNLTLACDRCNNEKSDYYDVAAPLVHPYEDDPREHVVFLGPVAASTGTQLGYRTVRILNLNRDDLFDRRREALQTLGDLIELYHAQPDGPLKRAVLREVRERITETAEYSAAATDVASRLEIPI